MKMYSISIIIYHNCEVICITFFRNGFETLYFKLYTYKDDIQRDFVCFCGKTGCPLAQCWCIGHEGEGGLTASPVLG